MTQKQIIILVAGVVVIGLVFFFVYRQFGTSVSSEKTPLVQEQTKTNDLAREKKSAEPETIDGIAGGIEEETNTDLSALDDEVNGEISDIQADSDSVTNLGTSYDENNL